MSDITDFNKVFDRLKNNYRDILTEEDIDSLFSESEFKQQVENISEIRLNINIIWIISSIVLIFLTVFALYKKYAYPFLECGDLHTRFCQFEPL